ncbi:MAG: GH1 family beta-glucosidase, partial [Bacillota bacterium]
MSEFNVPEYKLSEDFIFGTATSSYQIEGAWDQDGKGESIWDRFSHQKGNVLNEDTGDVACDHYNRFKEDIALMKKLNLDSYRFSISWPRVLPKGYGEVNQAGLDFYKELVDELLAADIEPAITLYHWDLPQALQEEGGWENRDTVNYFVEYAELLFKELGDKVNKWITHNEPWVASFLGHYFGEHAPGKNDLSAAIQAAHNILTSHGKAVKKFREMNLSGEIGITLDLHAIYPVSQTEADIEAADLEDAFSNRWFLDPVFKGRYPENLLNKFKDNFNKPVIEAEDMELISQEIDFLGINYYTRHVIEADKSANADEIFDYKHVKMIGNPHTEMGWEVYPDGLYDILVHLKEEYTDKPLYITENGRASDDKIDEYGRVNDKDRIDYYASHLKAVERAIKSGVSVAGYYAWSLMDNFEWAWGYTRRFGLIYVDFETKERILKDSARWYSQVIRNN